MIRNYCVYDNSKLDDVFSIKNVPIFCGCVDNIDNFEYDDLVFCISKQSGTIQIKNLIPPEKLYMNNHNDSVGKMWESHHNSFADFVKSFIYNKSVFEYGAGSCKLYDLVGTSSNKWTTVDYNPFRVGNDKLVVYKGDASNYYDNSHDVYVYSHFLEHHITPYDFIDGFKNNNIGSIHCISIPNQKKWLEKGYGNSVFFEHTIMLESDKIVSRFNKNGFKLLEITNFEDHSLFLSFIKTDEQLQLNTNNSYEENYSIICDYKNKITEVVSYYNKFTNEKYNIFSAHINTQLYFCAGLSYDNCVNIIDNSQNKHGKFLYGFDIPVVLPEFADKKLLTIVVDSIYKNEIVKQLKNIGYVNVV